MIKLKRIIQMRQKVYYLLLILAAMGSLLVAVSQHRNFLNSYQHRVTPDRYAELQRGGFKAAEAVDEDEVALAASRMSYQEYIQKFYHLYQTDEDTLLAPKPRSSSGVGVGIILALTAYVIGLLIAVRDALDGFDSFLFGLGLSRRKIFWRKLGPAMGLTALLSALVPAIMITVYYFTLPANLIGLGIVQVIAIIAHSVLITVTAFVVGYGLGRLIQKWVPLVIAAVLLPFSLNWAVSSLLNLIDSLDRNRYSFYVSSDLIQPGINYWLVIGLSLFGIVAGLALEQHWYRNDSAERFGKLLTVSYMRWPLIVSAVAIAFLISVDFDARGGNHWVLSLIVPGIVLLLGLLWQFWPQVVSLRKRAQSY